MLLLILLIHFLLLIFINVLEEKKWKRFNSEKIYKLLYGKFQGKKESINHFEKKKIFKIIYKRSLILPIPNPCLKLLYHFNI